MRDRRSATRFPRWARSTEDLPLYTSPESEALFKTASLPGESHGVVRERKSLPFEERIIGT